MVEEHVKRALYVLGRRDFEDLRRVGLIAPTRAKRTAFWINFEEKWKERETRQIAASIAATVGAAVARAGGRPEHTEQILEKIFAAPQKHYEAIRAIRSASKLVVWPFVQRKMGMRDLESLAVEAGREIHSGKGLRPNQKKALDRLSSKLRKIGGW